MHMHTHAQMHTHAHAPNSAHTARTQTHDSVQRPGLVPEAARVWRGRLVPPLPSASCGLGHDVCALSDRNQKDYGAEALPCFLARLHHLELLRLARTTPQRHSTAMSTPSLKRVQEILKSKPTFNKVREPCHLFCYVCHRCHCCSSMPPSLFHCFAAVPWPVSQRSVRGVFC